MKNSLKAIVIGTIFTLGYFAGSVHFLQPSSTQAEGEYDSKKSNKKKRRVADLGLSKETLQKVRAAHDALATAMEALKLDDKYTSASSELNALLILSGGGDTLADLESGRGVDPETFAALHVGDAVEEVKEHLGRDAKGRLTYKNKIVRLIPEKTPQRNGQ